MTAIPEDLVPLRTIAGRLRVPARDLIELSEQCAFPTIHCIGRRLRVSESEVERWWRGTAVDVVARRIDATDRAIRGGRRARR